MGEFDASGEIVTGALLGRTIDHGGGESHGHGERCLNCGTGLIGPHCHRCGQEGHVHRTIGEIWHEILHGVVHFDGKLWRTLPMLAFRPGELTRRYIAGERKRFVSPMALFLFSLFTMFAVFQIAGIGPPADMNGTTEFSATMDTAVDQLKDAREDAVEARDALPLDSPQRAEFDREIAEIDATLPHVAKTAAVVGAHKNGEAKESKTGWARLDYGMKKWKQNPGLMLYKLQTNSYKFSWLLIPLSLPFVWLMFAWKRGYGGYDHSVFITYSIAFMSLLFIAVTVLRGIGVPSALVSTGLTLIVPLHLYKHLKGAYRLGRLTALLRTILLMASIFIVLILFLLILVLLGLVG